MEERQIQVVDSRAVAIAPLDALATMSDAEFETRLAGLKTAKVRMARIQREMMTEGVDYGVIPGTGGKPTLLKPGAEVLCKFWHLVPIFAQQTIIGDGVTAPHVRILSTCSLHLESEDGPIVAQGIGSCNSWEKKYRYRDGQRKCPQCGAAAIIKGKDEYEKDPAYKGGFLCFAKKGGCGVKFKPNDPAILDQQLGQIENPDPYDVENTLEKMSAKRAQVDATLRATATSGLFTQDVEDMDIPPAPRAQADPEPPQQPTPMKGRGVNDPRLLARWERLWKEAQALGLKVDALPFPCSDEVMTARGKALAALIEEAHKTEEPLPMDAGE